MSAMPKPIMTILLAAVVAMCGVIAFSQEAQKPAALRYKVPAGWVEEERSSTMRVAQYKLPRITGDTEDGSLVLYYFGKGQGGSTAANIDRWASQMQQADGTKAKLTEESFTANGLKITAVDAGGTYVAETSPGSGTFQNKPGYRLRAAVVETPNGSYFVKFVGPEKTVAHWNEAFVNYLKSFEFR
ncbi:MAG TPA: hypothetical protein VJS17_11160 [Pyrinomonadaceae bacterium]|nr:hypothetical protein [Pyrinomonadaceae bacterium]